MHKQSSTLPLLAAFLPLTFLCTGCGGTTATAATGSTAAANANAYATAYKALTWGSAAMVSFPSSCSMTFSTTGVPPFHNNYYLAPVSSAYPTVVAVTPITGAQMSLTPYMPSQIESQTITVNICPEKASSTTSTNLGVIGYMLSGEALYNPYEGDGTTPALEDNVSYTFTDSSGTVQTASFIDACNSHPTPLSGGYTWHHHADPVCLTSQIDGSSGPSHLIGFALDGFPIYGGRDINGNVISVSQLDSCNGITSATPEFPNGAYHYVLPIGVTSKQSSLNCYTGTVTQTQMASAKKLICTMKGM